MAVEMQRRLTNLPRATLTKSAARRSLVKVRRERIADTGTSDLELIDLMGEAGARARVPYCWSRRPSLLARRGRAAGVG